MTTNTYSCTLQMDADQERKLREMLKRNEPKVATNHPLTYPRKLKKAYKAAFLPLQIEIANAQQTEDGYLYGQGRCGNKAKTRYQQKLLNGFNSYLQTKTISAKI